MANSRYIFFEPQYIIKAKHYSYAATVAGEVEKDSCHDDFLKSADATFHPLVETFGLWTSHSLLVIITKRLAYQGNIAMSNATTNLHEQLSVTLKLYNANMILHILAWTVETVLYWPSSVFF